MMIWIDLNPDVLYDKCVFGGELYTGVLFFNTKAYVDMVKALEQVFESE